jgi:hypothetical protein
MDRETKRVIRDTAIIVSIVLAFLFASRGCSVTAAVLSPKQVTVAKTAGKPMAQSQAIPPLPLAASNPVVVLPQITWGGDTNGSSIYPVGLAWDPSPDTNVIGYNVYLGVSSRVYTNMFTVGMATNCGVILDFGSEYYFAVTAFNVIGVESDYSSEVAWGEWLPDRVTVTWPTNPPCALLLSSVFSQPRSLWTVAQAKPSSGTMTVMLGSGSVFFCLQGSTNRLTIHGWNPLNQ